MSIGAQSQSQAKPIQTASRLTSWLPKALRHATSATRMFLRKLGLSSSVIPEASQEQAVEGTLQRAEQLPVQASRKLQMEQGWEGDVDVSSDSRDASAVAARSWSRVSSTSSGNSLARELFLHRFNGSPVNTVFAPGEYHIPE